jgi:hypothetical protein
MKAYWRSGGISPRILDLGTRLRWVVSFTTQPLHPQGKSTWYLLERRLGGPQSRSGHVGEEKNSQPLPGLKSPIIQPIVQRCITELFQLLNFIYFIVQTRYISVQNTVHLLEQSLNTGDSQSQDSSTRSILILFSHLCLGLLRYLLPLYIFLTFTWRFLHYR